MQSKNESHIHQRHSFPSPQPRQNDFSGQHLRSSRSWWRSPLVGYAFSLLYVLCVPLFSWLQTVVVLHGYVIGIAFVLGTFLVGWVWGTGPALLALVVGTVCTDYLILPPLYHFSFYLWPNFASLLPLIVVQLLILWLIARQKASQSQLLRARQEIGDYAEQVAARNRELAENNAQLEQANQMKDHFLSLASHELRTPVTSIHGYMQLLQRQFKRQSRHHPELLAACDSLDKVNEQTQRLVSLINDLLDVNTLRSGQMPLRLVPCDLCQVTCKRVEEQTSLPDRLVDLRLPLETVIVRADEARLSQVIVNLVSNALKYSPDDTTIRVEIRQKSGEAILLVQNEGPVLSNEQQEKIFEPFYRSPQVQSSATPGWGLGLTISKAIVEQHGGRLWVESSEGKGTTFFMALPFHHGSDCCILPASCAERSENNVTP